MNDTGRKAASSAEGKVNVTPDTENKKKEEIRRNKREEEEEEHSDEGKDDKEDADGSEGGTSPKMKVLWDEFKKHEKEYAGVTKSVNLENSPPRWDEGKRKKDEKESLETLLSSMRIEIITLVVNHKQTHTVTFFYGEKWESFKLSLPDFVDEFLKKVNDYGSDRGRMSPLLVEQCKCFLTFLIECRSHVDFNCEINEIDDSFGSPDMMKLFLSLMEELVTDPSPIVVFSKESTVELMKAFEFMKVFKDTRDSNARKYCCILMFLMLTTDAYIENMRRASWVQALKKKRDYLERRVQLAAEGKISMRVFVQNSIRSELRLLRAILKDVRLRDNNNLFDKIANVFGFVFNTGKVFHLMSKVFDVAYKGKCTEDEKLQFFTNLLDKVSVKCMDKANEKALAGNIDSNSTSCEIKRNANVLVVTSLEKFKTIISEEKDEDAKCFWSFVLCTVGQRETFLSDQLLFDIPFSCRGLRVEKKEMYTPNINAEKRRAIELRNRETDRRQDMWLKNAKNFFNSGHVNASFPSASDRPGRPLAFYLDNDVSYVFSDSEMEVKTETQDIEEEETDEEVEILFEVVEEVIIIDDEEEEQQRKEEVRVEDLEKKEERNEECEEVARTQRYHYLLMFFLSQLEENGGSTYVAHAMHGMRVIGIQRSAFGETVEWGNQTKHGEQTFEYLKTFMKRMLDQMSEYYARIQTKLRELRK